MSHTPNVSTQIGESNYTTPMRETGQHTPSHPSTSPLSHSPGPVNSPASSIKEGTGDLLDKIRKWPVKEAPSSRSAFGKLDFPKLPRVCIRHDNSPGRLLSSFAQYSLKDKYNHHNIQRLRAKLLKKEPPRSPPPNQTCAAIPRSQRNELELALMKHGIVETEEDPQNDSRTRRRSGGNRSDEWSSSSEESSDSEGLAPPRRKRRIIRGRKSAPPNMSCKTVPASDRTLPFLTNTNSSVSLRSPASGYLLSYPPPLQNQIETGVNGSDSDWDTDSDDSSWAYFDQPPRQQVNNAGSETAKVLPTSKGNDSSLGPSLEKHGPNSAPPVLAPHELQNIEASVTESVSAGSFVNATENNDEFSDIVLAREFAEMLPSPFGCLLPGYDDNPLRTEANHHGGEVNRRSRIQSDSALITNAETRMSHPVSGIVDDSNFKCGKGSPASARSTDSNLSNLSSLFSLPVSPSELASAFSEGTPQLDPNCDTVNNPFIPTSISQQHPSRELPGVPNQDILSSAVPVSSQNVQHEADSSFVPGVSMDSHFAGHISSGTTMPVGHPTGSIIQGVIRPIPTHPAQMTSRESPFPQQIPNATMPTMQMGHSTELPSTRNDYQTMTYHQPRMPIALEHNKASTTAPNPQYPQRFPLDPPRHHPSQASHQGSVIHHQPPSGSHLPPRRPYKLVGALSIILLCEFAQHFSEVTAPSCDRQLAIFVSFSRCKPTTKSSLHRRA